MDWNFIRTTGTSSHLLKRKTGHFIRETAQIHFIIGNGDLQDLGHIDIVSLSIMWTYFQQN